MIRLGRLAETDRAEEVDHVIARRIREARTKRGLTQEQLSLKVGVSYQQIQKYENGASRLSAGRLKQVADALGMEPGWFFPDPLADEASGRLEPAEIARIEQLKRLKPQVYEAFRQLVESSLAALER